jgi:hypothetical protein
MLYSTLGLVVVDNPYRPFRRRQSHPNPTRSQSTVEYLVSSAVIGTLIGASTLFMFAFLVVAPMWEPRMPKGDERWETIFFIAETVLPISTLVGSAFVALILRFFSFRLNLRGMIISCLAIIFFVRMIKPMISRLRGPNFPTPRFEWMPDLICAITAMVLGITLLLALVHDNGRSTPESD